MGPDGASAAWDPARLEYRFGLEVGTWDLDAGEYEGRDLDWFHFNAAQVEPAPASGDGPSARGADDAPRGPHAASALVAF